MAIWQSPPLLSITVLALVLWRVTVAPRKRNLYSTQQHMATNLQFFPGGVLQEPGCLDSLRLEEKAGIEAASMRARLRYAVAVEEATEASHQMLTSFCFSSFDQCWALFGHAERDVASMDSELVLDNSSSSTLSVGMNTHFSTFLADPGRGVPL
jgi:hypothetical protein